MPAIGGIAALIVLVLDQLSKHAVLAYFETVTGPAFVPVTPFFNLALVANHGVTFGMFSGGDGFQPWIFSGLALVIVAGLLYTLWRTVAWQRALAIGMIIGGAIGNLIDRLRFGSVVDFLDFYLGSWHWYVFNLADAAICVGVGLMLLDGLLWQTESPKQGAL